MFPSPKMKVIKKYMQCAVVHVYFMNSSFPFTEYLEQICFVHLSNNGSLLSFIQIEWN